MRHNRAEAFIYTAGQFLVECWEVDLQEVTIAPLTQVTYHLE